MKILVKTITPISTVSIIGIVIINITLILLFSTFI